MDNEKLKRLDEIAEKLSKMVIVSDDVTWLIDELRAAWRREKTYVDALTTVKTLHMDEMPHANYVSIKALKEANKVK